MKRRNGEVVLISVVTPVFNPDRRAFKKCVRSMLGQTYSDWEWCLVDDASTRSWAWKYLRRLEKRHSNITVRQRSENGGISRATNDAIAIAQGEYLAFLDHDDMLHRDALQEVCNRIRIDPTVDFIYTDEDKVDERGRHSSTFRKPDWSPERLLCQNYCCHLTVLRADLVRAVGGLRPDFDGAQDHDLLLRVTERTANVHHIRQVLYHWRISPKSTAGDLNSKPYAMEAMRRAIEEACLRRSISAELVPVDGMYFRVRRELRATPSVSIIIPTRGTVDCVWGLTAPLVENFVVTSMARSTYQDVEYVIVYDTGTDPLLLERLQSLPGDVKLLEFDKPFNFSAKCNLGAVHSNGETLLFLNDDVEVITPDWIERLICFLEDGAVGAVGPLLLFDDGQIQSAGHWNDSYGSGNIARGMSPSAELGIGSFLRINREVSGLTGACLALRRVTFFEIGGFSEKFPINFNDVDICFKLLESGYRILWSPDSQLFHFEGKTRGGSYASEEAVNLFHYWGHRLHGSNPEPFVGPSQL
jgi:GT2 family glycosyltransferase